MNSERTQKSWVMPIIKSGKIALGKLMLIVSCSLQSDIDFEKVGITEYMRMESSDDLKKVVAFIKANQVSHAMFYAVDTLDEKILSEAVADMTILLNDGTLQNAALFGGFTDDDLDDPMKIALVDKNTDAILAMGETEMDELQAIMEPFANT